MNGFVELFLRKPIKTQTVMDSWTSARWSTSTFAAGEHSTASHRRGPPSHSSCCPVPTDAIAEELSLAHVVALAEEREHSPKRLVRLICQMPVLSEQLLAVINSGRFGLYQHVDTVQQAVLVLGANTFRQLVWETLRVTFRPQGSQGQRDH